MLKLCDLKFDLLRMYVIQVADLRDNITMLNEAIAENKDQQTTILKNMQHQKYSPAAIQETKDRFNKRKDVFQVISLNSLDMVTFIYNFIGI